VIDVCGFRPFPGSGAYGHWACERPRIHLGRHRFRNYTIGRIPRIWRLRQLWASFKSDRGYRRDLFPTKYEPVP
jgi:hypothetical protein